MILILECGADALYLVISVLREEHVHWDERWHTKKKKEVAKCKKIHPKFSGSACNHRSLVWLAAHAHMVYSGSVVY